MTPAEVLAAHERETTTDARLIGRTYPHDRTVFVIDCCCGAEYEVEVIAPESELDAIRRGEAAHVLDALTKAGHVVVTLPEAHDIRVTAISMAPELDDPEDTYGPRIECRFRDIPKPGRLFDRTELAAALLAAAAAETGGKA